MSLPSDVPTAANLEFANSLGRALRGDAPRKPAETPERKQKKKRLAVKTARRRERHRE